MSLLDVAKHPLFVAISSLIIGTIIGSLVNRLRNRMSRINYFTTVMRIGVSTDDPVFGNIRVLLNDNQVRNLYIVTVHIENASNSDIENLELKAYVDQGTALISERTSIHNTSYIVPWSDAFKQTIAVPQGNTPTPAQFNYYLHTREYCMKALNRFQKAQMIYLCTRSADDLLPSVWLESPTKGVRTKEVANPTTHTGPILGVPIQKAAIRGIATSILVVVVCGLFLSNVWIASTISMITGITATLWGALEYRLLNGIRRILNM